MDPTPTYGDVATTRAAVLSSGNHQASLRSLVQASLLAACVSCIRGKKLNGLSRRCERIAGQPSRSPVQKPYGRARGLLEGALLSPGFCPAGSGGHQRLLICSRTISSFTSALAYTIAATRFCWKTGRTPSNSGLPHAHTRTRHSQACALRRMQKGPTRRNTCVGAHARTRAHGRMLAGSCQPASSATMQITASEEATKSQPHEKKARGSHHRQRLGSSDRTLPKSAVGAMALSQSYLLFDSKASMRLGSQLQLPPRDRCSRPLPVIRTAGRQLRSYDARAAPLQDRVDARPFGVRHIFCLVGRSKARECAPLRTLAALTRFAKR